MKRIYPEDGIWGSLLRPIKCTLYNKCINREMRCHLCRRNVSNVMIDYFAVESKDKRSIRFLSR